MAYPNPNVANRDPSVAALGQPVTVSDRSVAALGQPVTVSDRSVAAVDQPIADLNQPIAAVDQPVAICDPSVAAVSQPLLPNYGGGCIADLIPAILGFDTPNGSENAPIWWEDPPRNAPLLDDEVLSARSVVFVLLDGLGAEQLADVSDQCPTLSEMSNRSITSVAPSTTASALTSLTTGVPPGQHGIVGYRIPTPEGNLNILSWKTPKGRAQKRIAPETFQPLAAFGGQRPPVVSSDAYRDSGFTRAHLRDARTVWTKKLSSLVVETRCLVSSGEPFVYAYYDGPDVIAHQHGFGEHYAAELRTCDRLLQDLLTEMPRGTAVVVTSDHGLVDCSDQMTILGGDVLHHAEAESGEYRFRWLHAKPGRSRQLHAAAVDAYSDQAWVLTAAEIVESGWLGPIVTDAARARLGDVALVARDRNAFSFPGNNKKQKPSSLKGRHGSVTSAEMLVPLLTYCL